MSENKTVSFSRFEEVNIYNWQPPTGGFHIEKRVRFSRFEEIIRYEWVIPVDGFKNGFGE